MAIDLQNVLRITEPRQRDSSGRIWFVPFNITFRCELNCQFCYGKDRIDGEMSTEEVKKHVIDNIVNSKAKWLGFTGGDPLLRDDIFELMSYAKERGLNVLLSTNGALLNKERIARLKAIGVTRLGIGISGLKDVYKKVMGGGEFESIDTVLRLLVSEGFEVSLRSVPTRQNISTFLDLVDYAHELGVYKFCRYNMIYSGKANRSMDISDKYKNRLTMDLVDKQKQYPDLKIWLMERPFDNVLLSRFGYGDAIKRIGTGKCGATKELINVAPNGDVYPCPYFFDSMQPIGNLKVDNISDLAMSDARICSEQNITGICGECEHIDICNGCRYHALKFGNNICGGDPFCPIM